MDEFGSLLSEQAINLDLVDGHEVWVYGVNFEVVAALEESPAAGDPMKPRIGATSTRLRLTSCGS